MNKGWYMMLKKYVLACLLACCIVNISAQSDWVEWEENTLEVEDLTYWQEKYEELSELAEHPFNINTITKEQLEQLPFLSDKLIENILYYLYKYGPMVSKNELLGIEGMDWQTRHFLKDFIYIGPADNKKDKFSINRILKYNKQELITRLDIPLNVKAGYAEYSPEILKEKPNKKYQGNALYHNLRYRFQYRNQVFAGLTAEKDAGEPFFTKYNRKGYDSYTGYLFLQNLGRLKTLALGHYRASFGYGLVMNMGFSMGKSMTLSSMNRKGKGFIKHTSVDEGSYLQGVGATYTLGKRWDLSACYSFREMDGNVEDQFIKSLKTDGYHRLTKDLEKKNSFNNHLIGCNLSYNGKYVEYGLTAVYNHFNKMLNPDYRDYNRYYPRGKNFYNAGVHYKVYMKRFIFSGETAIDKQGAVSTLNMLTYSPDVNTTFTFINRYYDKRYQSLYASSFSENSRLQNEAGIYIGLESSLFSPLKILCYGDFFYFPWKRYQVDRRRTTGVEGVCQLGYSHNNSLSMLVKYSYKHYAKNYTSSNEQKYVLPYIRQRLHYQLSYVPIENTLLKTTVEYIRAGFWKQRMGQGVLVGETLKGELPAFPIQASLAGAWFYTDNYDSRVYFYEPSVLYAFSMFSFYGKGTRLAVNLKYTYHRWLTIQAKWGWTHYMDRNRISSGTEEIMGSNKADLQFQVRVKW